MAGLSFEPLCAETVGEHLARRGLLDQGAAAVASELGGGVSSVVLAVRGGGLDVVVKQALPRLRVEEEWLARRERALTEAAALRLAAGLRPGTVPRVLDVDAESCAIVIERAPVAWRPWQELLLEGNADREVAARVGSLLASLHRGTAGDREVAASFADVEVFDQLRVDPYYRALARRWPSLARALGGYVDQLERTRVCLVHAGCAPENVLVGEEGLWLLDFEVAHVGDPAFDLAFMLGHLMLKAIHRPAASARYRACAAGFVDAYEAERGAAVASDPEYVLGHAGCLMVARVDGRAPAEYLTPSERLAARAAGTRLLLDPPATLAAAWTLLDEAVAG